jgi:hypothetical protein
MRATCRAGSLTEKELFAQSPGKLWNRLQRSAPRLVLARMILTLRDLTTQEVYALEWQDHDWDLVRPAAQIKNHFYQPSLSKVLHRLPLNPSHIVGFTPARAHKPISKLEDFE